MHTHTSLLLPLLAGATIAVASPGNPKLNPNPNQPYGTFQRGHVFGRQEQSSSLDEPVTVTSTATIVFTGGDRSSSVSNPTRTTNPFRPSVPPCVESIRDFLLPISGSAALGSPTPDPSLFSYFAAANTAPVSIQGDISTAATALCSSIYSSLASASVPPGPLATAYTSYRSAYSSWASRVGPFATSLASVCRAEAASRTATATRGLAGAVRDEDFWAGQALLRVATDAEGCVTAYNVMVGAAVTLPPATGTGTGSQTVPTGESTGTQTEGTRQVTSSGSTAGAAWARETGLVAAAAMAAAGVVGVVGVL